LSGSSLARPLLAGLLALLLGACAVPRPAPVVPTADRDQLVGRLQQLARAYSSLRGLAKVRLATGEGVRTSSQVLIAERPDRFRVEVLAMFGTPLAILASDGSLFSAYLPGRSEFYRGPASADNLRRFIRLPLAARDLVGLLLYQPPLLENRDSWAVTTPQGPQLILENASGAHQEIEFDSGLRVVASRYFDAEGTLQLSARYDQFASESGFPSRMQLQLPGEELTAEIEFSELEINAAIDAGLFRLAPPAGLEVRPLP